MPSTPSDAATAAKSAESRAVVTAATIPAESFALSETFARVPEAAFRCETTVECGGSVLPLLRVRTSRPAEVDAALRADPTTEDVTLLADCGDERLYRVSWSERVRLPIRLLTAEGATILDLTANALQWTVRLLFPSRRALGRTVSLCEEHDVPVELRSIKRVGDGASGRYGLTNIQYDSLRTACERGYYKVPRVAKLDDLAEEAGVSHQAYSERLRRATEQLVAETLLNAAPTDGAL
ncbi:Bacterio-opsin activator HTH domain protein [Halogeometricum pallidum JCM 14848]|uniref:Bacterio-opsin activator HTH domain protein n=1 Tax=Halogeometricum pallidum JCM 14848 TaxID=1227487 RepID=M0D1H6_HALPD|nr:helix-turn-helix domain-containing protein [Halogeometricum pallidum]ELZ27989.1 Bacterio-opsin activator HTH domain protein [Halogeometricum pallidum JCM 14848]